MAKKITALFVRDASVNVIVTNGLRVEKWAKAPLDPGLLNQGVITDPPRVAAVIRDLFKQNQVRARRVVTGLPGMNSLYRLITLPDMPDALLAEAVKRETGRVLPVSLDEVYLAYQEVPSLSRGERRLFLATYVKAAADAMVRTARLAGLDPYLMDLAPLALSRIPDEPRCIIISARPTHADIVVVEDRLPQLIRVLSLPSEATSLAGRIPAIAEELNRTIVFYNSSHAEKPLNPSVPIFVAGEIADASETWPDLVGRLRFPVSALPVAFEHAPEFPANEYAVNMGLALKELAADRPGKNFSTINFNVLPQAYRPRRIPASWVVVPAVVIIAVGVLAYMGSLTQRAYADTAKIRATVDQAKPAIAEQTAKIAAIRAEIAQVTPQIAPIEAETARAREVAGTFTSTMSTLDANRTRVHKDLKERVVGLLPYNKEHLSLISVEHDGTSFLITGTAKYETEIFKYARKLRESGGIRSVLIASIQLADEGRYQFNMQIR